LDGVANNEPDDVQYNYDVVLNQSLPETLIRELGISHEDLMSLKNWGHMPLTAKAKATLEARPDLVASIEYHKQEESGFLYPLNGHTDWTSTSRKPNTILLLWFLRISRATERFSSITAL
jgi:signal peptidase I